MLAKTNARLACRGDVAAETHLSMVVVYRYEKDGLPLLLTSFRPLRI